MTVKILRDGTLVNADADWIAQRAIDAEEEATPVVPLAITPLQARKALRAAGLKADVDAYVATLSEEERDEWEYCLEVRRDHPVIVDGGAALGLSDDQIDALFIAGADL